jgi:chemotaxis protein MotA
VGSSEPTLTGGRANGLDFGAMVGFLIAFVAIGAAMASGGQLQGFLDPMSIVLVCGGALAATLINYPFAQIKAALRDTRLVFRDSTPSPAEVRAMLVELAEVARRQGVLALEEQVQETPEVIIKHGVQRVVDGVEPEKLRRLLENELDLLDENITKSKSVFDSLATYSPAFGMIGTVVGLINMLLTMEDPNQLGAAMGLALITTFYGSVLANLVFLPIAGKLRVRGDNQLLIGQMVVEGLVAIAQDENPSTINDLLSGFTGVEDDINRHAEAAGTFAPEPHEEAV